MTSPRSTNKKGSTAWMQCDTCNVTIVQTNKESHVTNCPPNLTKPTEDFVFNHTLYGTVDVKTNEEITGISPHELNYLVFLSQSVIQLCDLSIGEYAIVSDGTNSCARRVWPTIEKSLTSVLFTKNGLDLAFAKDHKVTVSRSRNSKPAQKVTIVCSPSTEVSNDLLNRIHKAHLGHLLTVGNKIAILYFGRLLHFQVKAIEEKGKTLEDDLDNLSITSQFYEITSNTMLKVFGDEEQYQKEIVKINPFDKIGGLEEEISEIWDLLNAALGKSRTLSDAFITRGVLLYGSPGTGKTMLANAFASSCNAHIVNVNKLDFNDEQTNTIFEDVVKRAPCLILLDDFDTICPTRTSRINEKEKKIVADLLKLFDCINEIPNSKIFVMAVSNKPDSVDPSFRRCGRLDREIEIPTPNPKGRRDILNKLLANVSNNVKDNELGEIANSSHGFVGTDLVALVSRAMLHATKRHGSKLNFSDLKFALTRVRPSAMREVQIEVPNVKWSDIGGLDDLKLVLRQAVEWPLKHPESFVRLGITPPKGVLMFGPPGCSKTMIAKALATESGLNFLSIKGPELFSKWVGESERAVREVFRRARQVAPSVVFFDEVDALGGERSSGSSTSVQERVLAQLLTELDGVTPLGDVTVLAATNRPDRIDKALLRPGRLDRIVYVPLPDASTRREIFKLKTDKMPVVDLDMDQLVEKTEGYSGAEVNAVCHEAAMKALEEDLQAEEVTMRHFLAALKMITPRTPPSLLRVYDEYLKH